MILSRFEDIREVAIALNVKIEDVALKKNCLRLSRAANPNGLNDQELDEW